tara:strand:+ start:1035 stop:1682 length:648 start_codon:yes stop_codon:yes gene_type:complete
MNTLDLCCGTKSFSKIADKYGYNTYTLDLLEKFEPTYCCDLLQWDYKQFPVGYFKIIWASPPCQSFSTMGGGKHRLKVDMTPKTDIAKNGDLYLKKVLEIIEYFKPSLYLIENPRALMRYSEYMINFNPIINECSYCKYGFPYMKNTDIFSNKQLNLEKCFYKRKNVVNNCHHQTIKGSHTNRVRSGVQRVSKETAYQVPPQLIEFILSMDTIGV